MRRWSSSPIVDDPEGRRRGRQGPARRQAIGIDTFDRSKRVHRVRSGSFPRVLYAALQASTEDTVVVRGREGEEEKKEKRKRAGEEKAGKGKGAEWKKRASCVCTQESGSIRGGTEGRELGEDRGEEGRRVRERRGEREEG